MQIYGNNLHNISSVCKVPFVGNVNESNKTKIDEKNDTFVSAKNKEKLKFLVDLTWIPSIIGIVFGVAIAIINRPRIK